MLDEKVLKYVDRLESEWEEHGKIIIGLDFDDTIFPWKIEEFDYDSVIRTIKMAKETGAYIVIFTASKVERYPEIIKFCESKDIEIDGINEPPIETEYGNLGKMFANIYIDDRAGLHESLEILTLAMYRIRGKRTSKFNETLK